MIHHLHPLASLKRSSQRGGCNGVARETREGQNRKDVDARTRRVVSLLVHTAPGGKGNNWEDFVPSASL